MSNHSLISLLKSTIIIHGKSSDSSKNYNEYIGLYTSTIILLFKFANKEFKINTRAMSWSVFYKGYSPLLRINFSERLEPLLLKFVNNHLYRTKSATHITMSFYNSFKCDCFMFRTDDYLRYCLYTYTSI